MTAVFAPNGGKMVECGEGMDHMMTQDLPEIDPQKVSLQVPSEIVSGGFNVVNRAAPVIGEVIQRTAERLVGIGASLKPLLASSLGFGAGGNSKRETDAMDSPGEPFEPENEESNDAIVTADPPSQFKRSPSVDFPDETDEDDELKEPEIQNDQSAVDPNAELVQKVINKILSEHVENKIKHTPEIEVKRDIDSSNQMPVVSDVMTLQQVQSLPNNPYYHQQYRDYNPLVKREAPYFNYQSREAYPYNPRYRQQYFNRFVNTPTHSY